MTKPIITLKNISWNKRLSEETPAYTATVCVDGEPLCIASNHGHGGGDDYRPVSADQKWRAVMDAVNAVDAHIKATYPVEKVDVGGGKTFDYEQSLEGLCHQFLYDDDARKTLRRQLGDRCLFVRDGQCFQFGKVVKGPRKASLLKTICGWAKDKHGDDIVILNQIEDFDEAFALYQKAAAA